MRTILIGLSLAALCLAGCAHMHIVCQDAGITSMAVGGNTAGQQVLSLGLSLAGTAASGAKLMAMNGPAPAKSTAQSQSYVDYNYLAAFGSDYASCTTSPPPQPPATSVIFLSANGGDPKVVPITGSAVVAPPLR